jgi:hypothetical protein
MTVVGMMQVVARQVVHVIAVRYGFMAAVGTVNVAFLVFAATVLRRATVRIRGAYFNRVFVNGIAVNVM